MPRQTAKIWECFEVKTIEGQKDIKCKYCQRAFKNNATKLKIHITKTCKQCPTVIKNYYQDYPIRNSPTLSSETCPQSPEYVSVPILNESYQNALSTAISLQYSSPLTNTPSTSASSLTAEEKRLIDHKFARAIRATGVPTNLLENPLWQTAIHSLRPDYEIPTSNDFINIEYYKNKSENMAINNADGLALILDGWSHICGRDTINCIIATPKPYFYKCIYPKVNQQTAQCIYQQAKTVIEEVGAEKFVAILTDNSSTMREMWGLVETDYPHIKGVVCASHTLNLLFNDISEFEDLKNTLSNVTSIIKYIKKHAEQELFQKIQREKYGIHKKSLKLPSPTHWGGCVIMMESFLSNREALKATVTLQVLTFDKHTKQHILSEDTWSIIESYYRILKPILDAVTKLESDQAVLSDVPKIFQYIEEEIKKALAFTEGIDDERKKIILHAIGSRRNSVEQPIHYAANILDPRYRGTHLSPDKIALGQEFVTDYVALRNLDIGNVMANFAEYSAKDGFYRQAGIWLAAANIHGTIWWKGLCRSQILSSIAIKLLSIPPSSATSERNWSLFGDTPAHVRNRLSTERWEKLIPINDYRFMPEIIIKENEECNDTDPDFDGDGEGGTKENESGEQET